MRDHLITRLIIENACRAGNLANMTLGELAKAKPDNGQMVVNVVKHKTLTSLGSAHLMLSPTICKWKQASLTFMRNKTPGAETGSNDHVFISSTGNTMSSSMVSAQLNSFWQKATDKVLVRVNAASFRKAAVSAVHEQHGHLKKDLADLLGHNQKTTGKFYLIRQKEKTAAKTSEALRNIMYRTSKSEAEEEVPEEMSQQKSGNEDDQSDGKLGSGCHRWTDEENKAVKSAFETAIEKKCINIQTVKDVTQGHEILSKFDASKVFDKVRSFIKEAGTKETVQTFPTETETQQDKLDRMFPEAISKPECGSVVSHKGGMTFSDHHTEIYWRLFRDLIESNERSTQQYVTTKLKEDGEVRKEVVGFTPQQLEDKIRTERRRIARAKAKNKASRSR